MFVYLLCFITGFILKLPSCYLSCENFHEIWYISLTIENHKQRCGTGIAKRQHAKSTRQHAQLTGAPRTSPPQPQLSTLHSSQNKPNNVTSNIIAGSSSAVPKQPQSIITNNLINKVNRPDYPLIP